MFERFTDDARKSMAYANQEAQRLQQTHISPEHILLGIATVLNGCGATVLAQFDLNLGRLQVLVRELLPQHQEFMNESNSSRAKSIIEKAIAAARNRDDTAVTTGHLLLALLADEKSILCEILLNLGVDASKVSEQVLLSNQHEIDKPAKSLNAGEFSILWNLWRSLSPEKRGEAIKLLTALAEQN